MCAHKGNTTYNHVGFSTHQGKGPVHAKAKGTAIYSSFARLVELFVWHPLRQRPPKKGYQIFGQTDLLASSAQVWVGARNSPVSTITELRDAVACFTVEVHDRGFDMGHFALLKTRDPEVAWELYNHLEAKKFSLGNNGGPITDTQT